MTAPTQRELLVRAECGLQWPLLRCPRRIRRLQAGPACAMRGDVVGVRPRRLGLRLELPQWLWRRVRGR